jgi:diketogulonate reductase-like aldo/keto reductase
VRVYTATAVESVQPLPIIPPMDKHSISRRDMLRLLIAGGSLKLLSPARLQAQGSGPILTRGIPSSGERLPLVGLGTWITFNVGDDAVARAECVEVMRAFFADGGRLIDSSPMYGSSQSVIGDGVSKLRPARLFSADKVWTGGSEGRAQIAETRRRWRVRNLDLVQVHNLVSWREHLPMLLDMKAAQHIRYVGITTSEGRRHREIEQIMRTQPLDFVQVTYNVLDREIETRILPLARERGIGVIVNRPFQQGALIRHVSRHPLPVWAREIDCADWAQFLLKFIVSHPVVTCAIPATSNIAHVRENMGASYGRLPDESMRRRMIAYVEQL